MRTTCFALLLVLRHRFRIKGCGRLRVGFQLCDGRGVGFYLDKVLRLCRFECARQCAFTLLPGGLCLSQLLLGLMQRFCLGEERFPTWPAFRQPLPACVIA